MFGMRRACSPQKTQEAAHTNQHRVLTPQKRKGIAFNKQLQLPAHKESVPAQFRSKSSCWKPRHSYKTELLFLAGCLGDTVISWEETKECILIRAPSFSGINTQPYYPEQKPQTSSRSRVNRNLSICPPSASSRSWLQSYSVLDWAGRELKEKWVFLPHHI